MLLIGAGGLGCAVATAIAGARWDVTVIDPDRVERSNLHRQVLFSDADLGEPKAVVAARALGGRAIIDRFGPENAITLAREHALVIEGTDRHETKFLAADACVLAGTPIVHAGVVGWAGWAMACRPRASACLRCVFEEVPRDASVATCAENGVIGAAVGAIGALQASLAARLLDPCSATRSAGTGEAGGAAGDDAMGADATGVVLRYDGRSGVARASRVRRRDGCALCGEQPTIRALDGARYAPACPA